MRYESVTMNAVSSLRKLILAALFTVVSVVLGYLLSAVPNIELMTLCVFLGGMFLGWRSGMLVGCLSILIYSLFNPFGPPLPPLLFAQLGGFSLVGCCGGLLRGRLRHGGRTAIIASAAAGCLLTIVYDFLTTAATGLIVLGTEGFSKGFGGLVAAGLPFISIHAASNTAIFGAAVMPVVKAAAVWEGREDR